MMFSMGLGDFETNHCLSDNIEVVKAENGILRRKLQSKTEGLMIISKEVETLKNELNQTKTLNEHLMNPKGPELAGELTAPCVGLERPGGFSTSSARERNRIELYKQLRKKNYTLIIERENLRQQLEDTKADISILRDNISKTGKNIRRKSSESEDKSNKRRRESREVLIGRMEELQLKHKSLKQDLQRLLDEKEDIVREKEEMNIKIHRMNYQLKQILEHDKQDLLDTEHIISENRYLMERLERIQDEKDLANRMGRRYKEALESSKNIICSKQSNREYLYSLLKSITFPVPQPIDLETSEGLSSLCVSLLETLSDRQLQIKHQRATNRELAERLTRLQDKLVKVEGGEILVCPSQVIMNNYRPSTDTDEVAIPQEELQRRLSRAGTRQKLTGEGSKETNESNESNVPADNSINDGSYDEVERPDTPQYEELQQRFENLLSILGSRQNSVDVEDNVFQDQQPPSPSSSSSYSSSPGGVVHYTCAKPPDILDFTRPSLPDIELEEEVAITIHGIEIVEDKPEEEADVELPDHIQAMVNKAMEDIQ